MLPAQAAKYKQYLAATLLYQMSRKLYKESVKRRVCWGGADRKRSKGALAYYFCFQICMEALLHVYDQLSLFIIFIRGGMRRCQTCFYFY